MRKRLQDKAPWIIAHRGYKARFPENTLAAFRAAVEAGADMVELDVMFSRDRKLVVIHDPNLDRTTNGTGPVNEHTLHELKGLDAGGWFHPRFAGETLPALEEVLDLLGGRVLVNVEIKRNAYEVHDPPDAVEKQILELVKARRLQGSVLVSSFEERVLARIGATTEGVSLAFITQHPGDGKNVEICRALRAFSLHPDGKELEAGHVRNMHLAGFRVFPYSVDTAEEIRRALETGVDGVITNDPALARSVRERMRS